jgi:hypothetical protein
MKSKFIISIFASILAMSTLFASTAQAQHRHGHHGHHGHHGSHYRSYNNAWTWVVPAIIGGAVVYSATRPEPVIIQQPPVIVQPPIYVNPEIRYIDGVAYRIQIMNINGVNQEVLVRQ